MVPGVQVAARRSDCCAFGTQTAPQSANRQLVMRNPMLLARRARPPTTPACLARAYHGSYELALSFASLRGSPRCLFCN